MGILKICERSVTFDIFRDFKPEFDELIAKVNPKSFYCRIEQ